MASGVVMGRLMVAMALRKTLTWWLRLGSIHWRDTNAKTRSQYTEVRMLCLCPAEVVHKGSRKRSTFIHPPPHSALSQRTSTSTCVRPA